MGPRNHGPMTGGGRGRCGGSAPRLAAPPAGPGFGWGRRGGNGGGWGHRHGFHATGLTGWQRAQMGREVSRTGLSQEQELSVLRQQAANLRETLDEISSRIQQLDGPVTRGSERERE